MILERPLTTLFSRPRLSDKMKDRLSRNAWWITLIVVIVSILTFIFIAIIIAILYTAILNMFVKYTTAQMVFFYVVAGVNIIFTLISTVLLAMAIKPLRKQRRRGWSLTYVATLLQVITVTIIPIVVPLGLQLIPSFRLLLPDPSKVSADFSTTMLIPVIALYCLVQVRDRFTNSATVIAKE